MACPVRALTNADRSRYGENRLLLNVLDLHEPHGPTAHGLRGAGQDRLRVGDAVLVALGVWLGEQRIHQANGMTERLELARPAVSAAVSLNADRRNLRGWRLFWLEGSLPLPLWHSDAGYGAVVNPDVYEIRAERDDTVCKVSTRAPYVLT